MFILFVFKVYRFNESSHQTGRLIYIYILWIRPGRPTQVPFPSHRVPPVPMRTGVPYLPTMSFGIEWILGTALLVLSVIPIMP